ncbi:hypothetical protein CathTA2_0672 [Caldalkalibacillus thermarum TA2.A1]|uniref:PrgI family protein n=1 Tax=Caldalkalibacillus thermarum (strain TA2.A1) TaxID=986075 RepID=F5L4G0_CALTT|nr:PrgI family protein [Caldalkalibacillus thermarum]EGL83771.1 hypothetical protein CathTA2_0672 [Caldalkalibacillus thermarum TA2.A1]QZT33715.1 PrgI family protein [Caldalkalibacillus thermarum TA2.A1]
MPQYNVPQEFDSEEKVIGGSLSLRQFVYLVIIAVIDLGGLLFVLFNPVGISFSVLLTITLSVIIPVSVIGLALAFFEHPEYGRLDKLLVSYIRYKRNGKYYR